MIRRAAVLITGLAYALAPACGPSLTWRGVSPDHQTAIAVATRDGLACVRVGERHEGCFDTIALDGLAFSQRGGHVAYPVRADDRWLVVRDGLPESAWQGVGPPVFSPDGAHLAYPAFDGHRWHMVLDDVAGEPFDSLFAGTIRFDPAGTHLAYVAQRDGAARVVVDGVAGPPYDGIGSLTFAPKGGRVAYVARSGVRATVVVDGVPGPWHRAVTEVAWSATGDHVAYVAGPGDGWYVFDAEARYGPYAEARGLAFHPGNGVPVFVVAVDGSEAVMTGDAAGPRYEAVERVVFGGTSAHWGYVAHDGAGTAVVLDGVVRAREVLAGDLAISEDGSRYAYLAHRDGGFAVVDDRGSQTFDLIIEGTLQFVPGYSVWACLAGDPAGKQLFVIIEGIDRRQGLDWLEVVRLTAREPSTAVLREWVGAEARRMLVRDPGKAAR